MRNRAPWTLLAGVAALAVAAVVTSSHSCGTYGLFSDPRIPLPGSITAGVLHGDQYYAITSNGHLVAVDLKSRKAEDLIALEKTLLPTIDVRDGIACVATKEHVYQIDLASRKILRSVAYKLERPLGKVGVLGKDRVYLQSGSHVSVISLADGKAISTLETAPSNPRQFAKTQPCIQGSTGKCLLAAASDGKTELQIVDLAQGKVIDRIPTPEVKVDRFHAGDICVVGDRAYLVCLRFSYGVWTDSFGYVDLKSRKYHALKLPTGDLLQGGSVVDAQDEGTILITGSGCFHYAVDGKLAGKLTLGQNTRLLAVWKGQALTAGPSSLLVAPLGEPVSIKK